MSRAVIFTIAIAGILLITCLCVGVVAAMYLVIPQPSNGPTPQEVVQPTSPPGPVTIVPAAQWYTLYFTAPRYPDVAENRRGGIDERLVAFIDTATQTIDLAIFDYDLGNVSDALVRASQRKVKVRMVTDSDTLDNEDEAVQSALAKLTRAGIPIVEDNRSPFMHNKFMVVDKREVWTGSWNFTRNDTYRLNNNAIKIASPQLAANYTVEFEKMFVARDFGPNKDRGVPFPILTIEGTRVENYFAPEDAVAGKIIPYLRSARTSIYFLAYSFTHDGIGSAMLNRAKEGVKVGGVFETTGSTTSFSEYKPMKDAGLEVYLDGNPYLMHHKVIIVDERIVIFGSFNFSENADSVNDENLLIIENSALAQSFKAEYDRIVQVAKNPPNRR